MKKAMFVQEVTVTDPDTQMLVQVSIYKDPTSGALFGIDSSFVEQVMECEESTVTEPFNNSRVMLVEDPHSPCSSI